MVGIYSVAVPANANATVSANVSAIEVALMRPTPWSVERYRVQHPFAETCYGDPFGAFVIPFRGIELQCIVADGADDGWEHVSVSLKNRTPNWYEMDFIKNIFWLPEETVVQFHVPAAEHINIHPNVLHLWRKLNFEFPLPPREAV